MHTVSSYGWNWKQIISENKSPSAKGQRAGNGHAPQTERLSQLFSEWGNGKGVSGIRRGYRIIELVHLPYLSNLKVKY